MHHVLNLCLDAFLPGLKGTQQRWHRAVCQLLPVFDSVLQLV
jgi:hypothetical protein